jgi:hypothetical protein
LKSRGDHARLGRAFRLVGSKQIRKPQRVKILPLDADEFLRRFLLHVVPRGFMRIRHFGLLANRRRRETLTRCRSLLGQPATEEVPSESVAELMYRLTSIDLSRCPVCGEGRMQVTGIVVHVTPPPDTS